MYLKSVNFIIMSSSDVSELNKIILNSLFLECQKNLLEKMKGSDFVFDCGDKVFLSCHKITLKRCGWYINLSKLLKNKKLLLILRTMMISVLCMLRLLGWPTKMFLNILGYKYLPICEKINWKGIRLPSKNS